jgi:hypothetical protein
MRYPIYIPSKGRWENTRTVDLLEKNKITNYFVVVEKPEAEKYNVRPDGTNGIHAKKLLVIPPAKGSSAPARNFCLEHAKKNGHKKIWMLDDDITNIYMHYKGKKCIAVSVLDCFERLENFSERATKVKAVGMRTSASFLKDVKKDLQFNCSLTSIYLLSVDTFRFRGTMLVDMDYQLQILRAGYKTLRMENYAFTFITPTKITGGYYDIYTDDKKRLAAIKEFCKLNKDVDPTVERNTTGFYVLKNISKIWRKFK